MAEGSGAGLDCGEQRACRKCGVQKPLSEFGKDGRQADGLHPKCKACRYRWHRQHRDEVNESCKIYHRTHRKEQLCAGARRRAQRSGVPCTITAEDIEVPTHCPVLGIPLAVQDGRFGPNSPTLDRLDPKKGYVRGNVAVISFRANLLKNNGSLDEIEQVIAWMKRMGL